MPVDALFGDAIIGELADAFQAVGEVDIAGNMPDVEVQVMDFPMQPGDHNEFGVPADPSDLGDPSANSWIKAIDNDILAEDAKTYEFKKHVFTKRLVEEARPADYNLHNPPPSGDGTVHAHPMGYIDHMIEIWPRARTAVEQVLEEYEAIQAEEAIEVDNERLLEKAKYEQWLEYQQWLADGGQPIAAEDMIDWYEGQNAFPIDENKAQPDDTGMDVVVVDTVDPYIFEGGIAEPSLFEWIMAEPAEGTDEIPMQRSHGSSHSLTRSTIPSSNWIAEPVVDTVDPVVDTVDPVVDTVDPVVDTVDPVVDTVDPVVDTVDPVEVIADPKEGIPEAVSWEDSEARMQIQEDTNAADDSGHRQFMINNVQDQLNNPLAPNFLAEGEIERVMQNGEELAQEFLEEANELTSEKAEHFQERAAERRDEAQEFKDKAAELRKQGHEKKADKFLRKAARKDRQAAKFEGKAAEENKEELAQMIVEYMEYLSAQLDANIANADLKAAEIAENEAFEVLAEAEARVEGFGDNPDRADEAQTEVDDARAKANLAKEEADEARAEASLAEVETKKALDEAHTAELDLLGGKTAAEVNAEMETELPKNALHEHFNGDKDAQLEHRDVKREARHAKRAAEAEAGGRRRLQTMERLLREIQLS